MSEPKICHHVITLRDGTTRKCKLRISKIRERYKDQPYCSMHLWGHLRDEEVAVGRYLRSHDGDLFMSILRKAREVGL